MSEKWSAHVAPHGELEELGPSLWSVRGSLNRNPLPRNMVIWKMPSGGLLLHSCICLNDEGMNALEALGPVEILVVPCHMHTVDIKPYQERFPESKTVAPQCTIKELEGRVRVDESVEDCLLHLGVTVHKPKGVRDFELHLEIPLDEDNTALIVTDILFNLEPTPPKGFGGFMLKLFGSVKPLGMTPIGKRLLLQNADELRAYLHELAAIQPLSVLCVAHGQHLTQNVGEELQNAANRL